MGHGSGIGEVGMCIPVRKTGCQSERDAGMFKVFLVEDEIVVREGIRDKILWEQYGFHYAGDAPDGELALPLIRQIKPDLLITDIKMPFMDGLALTELVRKELPNIKIVIISGHDDFSYAQKAIGLGVEQYLLKPILKATLAETLMNLQQKMLADLQQQEYLARFAREAQEYEMYSRRRFFENVVTGGLSVTEISETAREMGIDLNAQCYNIVLYSLSGPAFNGGAPEQYTDLLANAQDQVTQFVIKHPELILFRWNITTYAVLIKGETEDIAQRTQACIEDIQCRCEQAGRDVDWHVASGTPVSRLSAIPACFSDANRILSYRYLCPDVHVLTEALTRELREQGGVSAQTGNVEIDRGRIHSFLMSGVAADIDPFIDQLLHGVGEDASLPLFCRYLTVTVSYAAAEYLDAIGCRKEGSLLREFHPDDSPPTLEDARKTVHKVLRRAIDERDSECRKQQSALLTQATAFIDAHYRDESVSLDRVARQVNISPNYFSAMFSQEVGQTFIEYLTGKRIGEAKRLLRQTDMRASEIAVAVGYKDSHYFSFVFRKVAGCTPSEYRKGSMIGV